ncbi:MAG: FAD-binding domain-containing protein, partial [Maribacter sp.]
DSNAVFIKKYVPELAELPVVLALTPWDIKPMEEKMYSFEYGLDYPTRIIDIEKTRKIAAQKLYGQRKSALALTEKERILETHTMRRKENE